MPKKVREEGKRVAVIGAGPAGISAAYYLAVEGHSVTVFDRNAEPGGMLRYGVPSFRLEKDVLASEIEVLKELGVEFRCGIEIGNDITIQQLRDEGYAALTRVSCDKTHSAWPVWPFSGLAPKSLHTSSPVISGYLFCSYLHSTFLLIIANKKICRKELKAPSGRF